MEVKTVAADDKHIKYYFVYDPLHSWTELRGGMVFMRPTGEVVRFWLKLPEEKDILPKEIPVADYNGQIKPNILSNAEYKKGEEIDATPWLKVQTRALAMLRDARSFELSLSDLISALQRDPKLSTGIVEETLKMMVCRGTVNIRALRKDMKICVSEHQKEQYRKRQYLASFSDELLVKSKRVDLLVAHHGTVGSYREELLRNLLKQVLPGRYSVGTGFVEGCPRQIDILIWDSVEFPPLFKDQDVVVVSQAAVRGAIEVKTRLNATSLKEGMHILWDAFGRHQPPLPVFKGIFAYDTDYKSDAAVALKMKAFYNSLEQDGITEHKHRFLYAGVSAVCVPRQILVRERYELDEADPYAFHQPILSGMNSDWPGDTKMSFFLGLLMAHLSLPQAAKDTINAYFTPILSEMENVKLCATYDSNWQPSSALTELRETLQPKGSREYRERFSQFLEGELSSSEFSRRLSEENR